MDVVDYIALKNSILYFFLGKEQLEAFLLGRL